ncbi:MAG TPA: hypothetical protein VG273_12880 [Bryobacteraceae bacterium]|nr:hypothetical protein [Bryobacteraceae bacterium]
MHPAQISDKRREANRQNARFSAGPVSASGKAKSSHNAVRHGFTGQVVILTPDDRAAHDEFCAAIISDLKPETAVEHQLAQSISEDFWRSNRLRAAENNILAKASAGSQSETQTALDTADAFLRESKQLQLLSLYEQRINRAIQKNMDQLRRLQADRRAGQKQQMEEAMLLAQLSLSKGIPYDPTLDFPAQPLHSPNGQALSPETHSQRSQPLVGALSPEMQSQRRELLVSGFVLSSAEINSAIDRNNRLNEARHLNLPTPKPKKQDLAIAA